MNRRTMIGLHHWQLMTKCIKQQDVILWEFWDHLIPISDHIMEIDVKLFRLDEAAPVHCRDPYEYQYNFQVYAQPLFVSCFSQYNF